MTLGRTERREAHSELREHARYYERQRTGLGLDFLDAVDTAIDAIDGFPDAWHAHHRKRPGYWLHRVTD